MDRDNNSSISREELNCNEFQEALRSIVAPRTVGQAAASYARAEQNVLQLLGFIIKKADGNHDGSLSLKEFESFTRELRNRGGAQDTTSLIFALFDLDGDHILSKSELRETFRYFLGHHPSSKEFEAEWAVLDHDGTNRVTKEQFCKWLRQSRNPAFRQHASPVLGRSRSEPSSPTGRKSPKSQEKIFRPAPGCMPPRRTGFAADPMPEWNEHFASKDPSEINLANRGNIAMKNLFSKPQSLVELRRFYGTYKGFQQNLNKMRTPEEPPPRYPVLSHENKQLISLPGLSRHMPGGNGRNARGEEVPWRECTPRTQKAQAWEPMTITLRLPVGEAPRLHTPWTERHEERRQLRERSRLLHKSRYAPKGEPT